MNISSTNMGKSIIENNNIASKEINVPMQSINYYNSTTTLVKNDELSNNITVTKSIDNNNITENNVERTNKEGIEEYNPYEHRILEHPNSFLGAFLHIAKTSLGTGILAIPRAFKSAGLLVGVFGTIFVGSICTHAIHILVKSSQKVCKKTLTPSLGFAETAEGIFKLGPPRLRKYSSFAKIFIEASLFSVHFLAGAVYLVFISISLTKLFAAHFPEVDNWPDYTFKLIILIPLLICGQVRELKHLVPFSFLANLMLLITFGITGYYMFTGINEIDIKERNFATGLAGIPSFFSTVLFSMEGIGTIMPVENSMITPNFIGCPGVLNLAMTLIIILYTSMGFLGYYKFGEATEPTITANLPDKDIAAGIAQATIALAVFFSFMLLYYVPFSISWNRLEKYVPESRRNISQILLRSFLILVATAIAIAGGENLGLLIDLVGAIFLSILGLFVPAFLEVIADWYDGFGIFKWRLIKDLTIMLMAIIGLISGVYSTIKPLL